MKLIIQRVSKGSVTIDDKVISSINHGYVVLVGIRVGDTKVQADRLAQKLLNLRIMADDKHPMNQSVLDVKGQILLVSQFTLYANTKGRRPGFTQAMPPKKAKELFDYFVQKISESGLNIQTGQFGAMMSVKIVNDGPVTITIEENSN